jgi:hypothetical protein
MHSVRGIKSNAQMEINKLLYPKRQGQAQQMVMRSKLVNNLIF